MQGNVVKAAVWLGASMVVASVILVVGFYVVVASQAQRTEQALLKARSPVETTIKFSGLEQLVEPLKQAPYAGLTLPSGKYMHDDVKYFPAGLKSLPANSNAATPQTQQQQMPEELEANLTQADDTPENAISHPSGPSDDDVIATVGGENLTFREIKASATCVHPSGETIQARIEKLLTDSEAMRVDLETIDSPPAFLETPSELHPFRTDRNREPQPAGEDE
ncbi:MAG TPA: hypothetical protein VFT74_09155 [Isosphaeraceae bacterium]|nr:hypothetical protein [Isosphaeraceae bacterium]